MQARELLKKIGFEEVYGKITEKEPSYSYDFGNLKLSAIQVTNFYLKPVFSFGGVAYGTNSLAEINFEIPLELDSFEQGIALIAYGIGKGFQPLKPTPWLVQGRDLEEIDLPWVQVSEAYKSRPQCFVDREWFRVAVKKLRKLAASAKKENLAEFSFDGEVFRINACGSVLIMPAQGMPWGRIYSITASELDFLPKRLMRETISVDIWNFSLGIGNRRWKIVQDVSATGNPPGK